MVVLEFGDSKGDSNASLRLAEYLASLGSEARTVAWVSGDCKGFVGVAALACDDIVFGPEGKLGAGKSNVPTPEELESFEITIRSVARQKDRDWSTAMAIVNPKMAVKKYRNIKNDSIRLMGKAEFDELPQMDAAKWIATEKVNISEGIDAELAKKIGVAQDQVAASMDLSLIHISEPTRPY